MADFLDSDLWKGVLSNGVYGLICWIASLFVKRINLTSSKNPGLWRSVLAAVIFFLWALTNIFIIWKAESLAYLSIVITTVVAFLTTNFHVRSFQQVGLAGADRTIRDGLGYKDALRLCHNGLDFLGIGGSKLTDLPEFEAAIRRCHRENKPVRFLLARPDNQRLLEAAKRNGVDPAAYKTRVEKSLGAIADLRNFKSLNVEVRMYKNTEEPIFRLMFINEFVCLLSYNVFGEGDGSQLPQLYLQRVHKDRDTNSFYHPFRRYFDDLWDRSKSWDFNLPVK